jgi:paraquat-inducible protein A
MTFPRAIDVGLMACRVCGQVTEQRAAKAQVRCVKCHRVVTPRMAGSLEKTLAWLIAAIILYFPANILPVVHTGGVNGQEDSTIIGGILEFWRSGSWDIAALIFTASVAVPVTKFLALGLLLWTVRRQSPWARRERAKLYKFVEFIGYWSMLDVVVVAITCSLLQFRALESAEPRLGIVFFCSVVVATMVAAFSFDPRLIWDAPGGAT